MKWVPSFEAILGEGMKPNSDHVSQFFVLEMNYSPIGFSSKKEKSSYHNFKLSPPSPYLF